MKSNAFKDFTLASGFTSEFYIFRLYFQFTCILWVSFQKSIDTFTA